MALQMFQVKIGLVAMRALVLSLCVLGSGGRRLAGGGRGPSGMRRQNSATTLLANNVQRLRFLVGKHRRVGVQRGVLQAHALARSKLVVVLMRGCGGHHGRL